MNQEKNRWLIFFLLPIFIILVLMILIGIIIQKQKKERKIPAPMTAPVISPSAKKQAGRFKLIAKANQSIVSQNQPLTLLVLADSSGQPITGYDLVFILDETKVGFLSQKNLYPDFQLFPSQNDSNLILTGVKKLTSQTAAVFNNTPLVELNFSPKKTGRVDLGLLFKPGSKKDSNLINEKSEEILDKVEGLTFFSGEKLTLVKNQNLKPKTTDLSLNLAEIDVPDERCRDCISFAKVMLTKEGQTKLLEFKTGGIAGLMNDEGKAFGFGIKLLKFSPNQIELILFPQ